VPGIGVNWVKKKTTTGKRTQRGVKRVTAWSSYLLDVMAITVSASADPSFAARVAPPTGSTLNADSLLGGGEERCTDDFIAVDADEMTTQVMLPAE
jgi:hypothetical protein